ncbi:MAG: D-arabinono-1,4-lactone oxidase [Pseudomonadota bacterium]|nr:D-arabinono-1,4-lactone oxidase [Pseudomonadota bacterium]
MPTLPWRDRTGVYHPRAEAEVVAIVRYARALGLQVRSRGARHSIPAAIHTDAWLDGRGPAVELMLDRMAEVHSVDEAELLVTVGAGCRFGADPRDVTRLATDTRSLGWYLEQRGWALPDLGGVSHQSIAGFLATGSSGGTLSHAVLDTVVALRLVDGTGAVHALSAADPDRFHAALVSLGLFGVVTEVTLRCVPRYDVVGEERCTRRADAAIDLYSDGPDGLAAALRTHEYLRLMWWPQPEVDKLVVWRARRAIQSDPPQPRRYVQMPPMLGSSTLTLSLAGLALGATAWWRDNRLLRPVEAPRSALDRFVEGRVFPALYNEFVPVDAAPRPFRASWREGLPMDDQMDERLLPVTFTELFVPIDRAGEALRRIRDLVARDGLRAAGTFAIEIYGARATQAWLSPSYGGDQVRIDLFWSPRAGADPDRTWFPQFWSALADLGARPHWGKHLPVAPDALRAAYPRMDAFLALRATFDPDAVFLNRHWRTHLGLLGASAAPSASPLPPNGIEPERTRWNLPMPFRLRPSVPAFAARAPHRFDHSAVVDAPPEQVDERLWRLTGGRGWYPWYRGVDWPAGPPDTPGGVLDVSLAFARIRVRVVEAVAGRRFVASIDACTLPLAAEMLEEVTFTPRADGRTDLRWIVHYEPHPAVAPFHRLVAPFFDHLFRQATRRLAASFTQVKPA